MPPSNSHSPRRKRVRKYVSTSALKWNAKNQANAPATNLRKRRGSSASASTSGQFTPSQNYDSRSDLGDLGHLDDSSSAISHAETFPILPSSNRPPLAYSSLPPTPISSSPAPRPREPSPPRTAAPITQSFELRDGLRDDDVPPFSLWDYLREELLATDFDSHQELKWERVSNFLSMPIAIEKVSTTIK